MSRFFESLDEEKPEIKKKLFSTESTKSKTKQSKREKMMHELQTRVFDLEEDDSKKNEKNIKKFISDLKKYEYCLDEIPKFLKNFLTSERVYVKSNKKIIDQFISQYSEEIKENDEICEPKFNIKDEDEFNDIIKIVDSEKRIKLLLELLKRTNNDILRIDILVLLLIIYYKNKDVHKIEEVIVKLLNYLDNEKVKNILKNNIDNYIELIRSKYDDNAMMNEDKSTKYINLLKSINELDNVVSERRILEYNMNYSNSRYIDFELLSLCQKGLLSDTLSLFESNRGRFFKELKGIEDGKKEKNIKTENYLFINDYIFTRNMEKLGHIFFDNEEYFNSFLCFYYVYQKNLKHVETKLFILCVVFNKEISKTDIFKNFITCFREVENNIFMSRSNNQRHEIFRSFYFLNVFDIERCYKILLKYNFRKYSLLEDFLKKSLKN